MTTDTTSIFYKIGQATKQNVNSAISDLLAADNNFTGTMTIGTQAEKKDLTVNGGTTITGDLTVQGLTTTLSTTNLDVKDNFIRLSEGASAGVFTKDQGFYFERGLGQDAASLVWDESAASFVLGTVPNDTPAYLEETITNTGDSLTFVKGDTSNPNHITSIEYHYDSNTNTIINGVNPIIFNAPAGSDFTVADYQSIKGSFANLDYKYEGGPGATHTLTISGGGPDLTQIVYNNNTGTVSYTVITYTYHAAVAGGDSTSNTVTATPGAVNVGSLKIGTNPLGGLDDFNAGLSA